MRRVRYSVAASLDGFIAGPDGEYDWIIMDPAIDFRAFFAGFDTVLLGRRTFELTQRQGPGGRMPGMDTVVISRTLRPADYPGVTVRSDAVTAVQELKARGGKDIWLMGGGELFRSLLDARLVDSIEIGLIPVLLGAGVLVMTGPYTKHALKLTSSNALPSGILMLRFEPNPSSRGTRLKQPKKKELR